MASIQAIGNCRVSSEEQLKNNSLPRQMQLVEDMAKNLNVELVRVWSGCVSAKVWTNIDRDDLNEMLAECKKNRRIKYAIFDEPDRFVRAMMETGWFFVEFRKLGVEVKFAAKPDLNTDNATNTLLLLLEMFKAEGSNEERQHKSIAGLTKAIEEGRYPFHPKIGYAEGCKAGVHIIDPQHGCIIKDILYRVAERLISPSEAVKEFNDSEFVKSGKHCPYKLDKFRLILTDPYYAGIVEMSKQVNKRNENGLHEAMITITQHQRLLEIVNNKHKCQKGARKGGNPKYVMNRVTVCEECAGKYVGFDHTNGKTNKVYERYRCRGCGKYMHMEYMHNQGREELNKMLLPEHIMKRLKNILGAMWDRQEQSASIEKANISREIKNIEKDLNDKAVSITDPSNALIKDRLLSMVETGESHIKKLRERLETIDQIRSNEKQGFLAFALKFIGNLGDSFFDNLTLAQREMCKQILFSAGFCVSPAGKVYTPEISPIYRLANNKKDLSNLEKSLMVRVKRL